MTDRQTDRCVLLHSLSPSLSLFRLYRLLSSSSFAYSIKTDDHVSAAIVKTNARNVQQRLTSSRYIFTLAHIFNHLLVEAIR